SVLHGDPQPADAVLAVAVAAPRDRVDFGAVGLETRAQAPTEEAGGTGDEYPLSRGPHRDHPARPGRITRVRRPVVNRPSPSSPPSAHPSRAPGWARLGRSA